MESEFVLRRFITLAAVPLSVLVLSGCFERDVETRGLTERGRSTYTVVDDIRDQPRLYLRSQDKEWRARKRMEDYKRQEDRRIRMDAERQALEQKRTDRYQKVKPKKHIRL